ncbi:MAG TPA: hypothetical protein ENK06_03935 [Gammaproteobacteria bacterium]|nr:hypothetical protein [Gammaproteobacteria bacterium]
MTRDYKNVPETKAKIKKANKKVAKVDLPKSLPVWFVLFSGVVIGSFVSFLVYLGLGQQTGGDISSLKPEAVPVKPNESVANKAPKPEDEKKHFDFYTVLRERNIEVPLEKEEPKAESTESIREPAPVHRVIERKPPTRRVYMFQVGSFSRFKDADKRKASLALLGVSSKIHAINKSSRTMYRVQVGPFGDIKKVNEVASFLKQNKIPSLLMKVKG